MPQDLPTQRFKAVQTPDDRWAVFDEAMGMPMEHDGVILIGLDRRTALIVERHLNATEPAK